MDSFTKMIYKINNNENWVPEQIWDLTFSSVFVRVNTTNRFCNVKFNRFNLRIAETQAKFA